jgi:hypothetical protein
MMMTIGSKIMRSINYAYDSTIDDRSQSEASTTSNPLSTTEECCETYETRRKSCIKQCATRYENVQKRVNFTRKVETRTIMPLYYYKKELWWTKDELLTCQQNQFDLKDESQEVVDDVEKYLDAYMTAYDNVFQKTADGTFNNKISERIYKIIVEGRSKGYGGLELYLEQPHRHRDNQNKILLTIASSQYFIQSEKKSDAANHVRSYSRSLTAADRYWACVIGNADASDHI